MNLRYKLKNDIWVCVTAAANTPNDDVLAQIIIALKDGIDIATAYLRDGASMEYHGGNSCSRLAPGGRKNTLRASVTCYSFRPSAQQWIEALTPAIAIARHIKLEGGGIEDLRAALKREIEQLSGAASAS